MDFDAIKDYVPYVLEFNVDDLKTATLPGIAEYANGVAIYSADSEESKVTINELFYGITTDDETDGNVIEGNTVTDEITDNTNNLNVEVLNGSGNSDNLNEVVAKLESEGFNVIQTGNTSTTNYTTIISRSEIDEQDSNKLKEIFNIQNIVSGESSTTKDVTIIIGKDY